MNLICSFYQNRPSLSSASAPRGRPSDRRTAEFESLISSNSRRIRNMALDLAHTEGLRTTRTANGRKRLS